ncbi:MAG: NAD-dependent epimerase/dehydratase family protein [Proteobacteria bacterium]|nr:NAD-dependent epimerase/dehydratase family protein [Pseudomonadota bacterium]
MILITGGAGLIGSTLAKSLLQKGEDVIICDTFSTKKKWENVKDLKDAIFVDPDNLNQIIEQYIHAIPNEKRLQKVFHFAAYTVPTESDYLGFVKNNIGLSRQLLNICKNNKIDFFYASSSATYGSGELGFSDKLTIEELKEINIENPYAWSKQQFDFEASRFFEKTESRIVGFKFFNTYGDNESHKLRTDSASVPYRFKQAILKNEDVVIFTDPLKRHAPGHQQRDFIKVDDAITLVQKVAFDSNFNGLINIGSGRPISFVDLFNSLKENHPNSTSKVVFKEMTIEQAEQYQFFTCAKLDNLKDLKII